MRPIIFTSNNLVESQYNNVFTYNFPSGGVVFKNNKIALTELSMYNSFYNITSATTFSQYDNNFFQYEWIDNTLVDVVIPDGFYTFADINAYLQSVMTANKHYLLNNVGEQVFYLQLQVSANVYAVQLNTFVVPSSLPSGWSLPAGATWSISSGGATPLFVISATGNFKTVVGFNPGAYPQTPSFTNYSALSSVSPEISPVNSIYITCSLVNNNLSIPNNFITSFTTGDTKFGKLISLKPANFLFSPMYNTSTSNISITFMDQDLRPLYLIDTNLVVILAVDDI